MRPDGVEQVLTRKPLGDRHASLKTAVPAMARQQDCLIVDDSADTAESSAMLLRLDDHEIQIAFDGPSALEASRSFKPEIVLLDIGLPGFDRT